MMSDCGKPLPITLSSKHSVFRSRQERRTRMRKSLLAALALIGLASAGPAFARSNVGFSIYITNAPPPPVVVYQEPPRFEYIPEHRVYVVDDDDCGYEYFR